MFGLEEIAYPMIDYCLPKKQQKAKENDGKKYHPIRKELLVKIDIILSLVLPTNATCAFTKTPGSLPWFTFLLRSLLFSYVSNGKKDNHYMLI